MKKEVSTNKKQVIKPTVNYNYFVKKQKKLIKNFDKFCLTVEKELTNNYDVVFAKQIIYQAKNEFTLLIPRIPYYGGTINPFNELIIVGSHMISVHKAMQQQDKTAEETVSIFYDIVNNLFEKTPKPFLWIGQKFVFSNLFIRILQKVSSRMSQMDDPNAFDFTYYKDDGKENDWHFVATKCGIVNFFKQEGCADLAPYCNFVDAIQGGAFNMGVHCKTCLGDGDSTCEEYMKQGRKTIIPERIEKLLENRKQSTI